MAYFVPEERAGKSSCGESGDGTPTFDYSLKQRLAAGLYRRISIKCPADYAGKVTFTLLTCDVNLIVRMLEDEDVLRTHCEAVFKVLQMTRCVTDEDQLKMFDKVRVQQRKCGSEDSVDSAVVGIQPIEYSLKQQLASPLYHKISKRCHPNYAGRATFILLRSPVKDIQRMLEDDRALASSFETAFNFLYLSRCLNNQHLNMLFNKIQQPVLNLADKVGSAKCRLPLVQYSSTKRFAVPLFRQISGVCSPKYAGKITYILLRCDMNDIQRILEDEAALSISVKTIFDVMQNMSNSGDNDESLKLLIDCLISKEGPGLYKSSGIKYSRETLYAIGKKFVCRKRIKVDIPEIIAEKRVFDQTTGIKRSTEVMYLESSQKRYPFRPWTTSSDYHSYFRNEHM